MDFTLNRTWPTFSDYIPVYKISIQYTNPFQRYHTESKSVTYGTDGTDVCTDSGDTICPPHWKWRGHNKRAMKTDNIRKLVWTNYVTNVYKNQECPGSVTFVFSLCAKEKLHSAHFFDSPLWNQKHNIFLGLIRNILCHALLLWHHTGHLGFTVMLIWCFTPLSTLFKSYCDMMKGSIQWSTVIHRHEQNFSSSGIWTWNQVIWSWES